MDECGVLHAVNRISQQLESAIGVAASIEDERTVRQLSALKSVMDTKYIPVACPGALCVAGEAALAAYDGESEAAWYARALREAQTSRSRETLTEAVRLLRGAGLWPWQRADAADPLPNAGALPRASGRGIAVRG